MSGYFIWLVVGVLIFTTIFAARAWIGYARIEKDAAEDWDYKVSQNMDDPNLTKDGYIRAYKRAYAPRREKYIAITSALLVVMTPLVFIALNAVMFWLWQMDQADGQSTEIVMSGRRASVLANAVTFEPGNMVYGFFGYFGILAIWAGICAVAMRLYYRRAPGPLRDEILRERMH